jgi:cytoskeletal protein RodZ
LEALEKGNFKKLPAGIYGKNFLKDYAIFLKLGWKDLEKKFIKELEALKDSGEQKLFAPSVAKSRHFIPYPKIARGFALIFVVGICFFYLGNALKKIYSQPNLFVANPQNNLVVEEKTININGRAEAEAEVIINGEKTASDKEGNFSETVYLKEGVNMITVTAKKKYGRENTIKRQILVKDS